MMNKPIDPDEDPNSYTTSDNKITRYIFGIAALALFGVYAMMEIQATRARKRAQSSKAPTVYSTGKAQIGGEWELTDTQGKPFGSRDLEGSYYLIYFGFTNCPDICPNSLMKLGKALEKIRKMPEYSYIKLTPVFVSVDPDRDTPEKIKKFATYFDPTFIGVTGKSNDDPTLR
jgi:cytochrome oxidase Cu insertion factor (SCO1/SenC/PrrC family)